MMEQEKCSISSCDLPQYDEGVCYFHYMLREYWGYELGGYQVYMFEGTPEGRSQFMAWVESLGHQKIINIFANYDHKLEAAVHKSTIEVLERKMV